MALQKPIQYNNAGVEISYWRITNFKIDYELKQCNGVLAGYLGSESREEGKNPLVYMNFNFSGDRFPFSDTEEPISERSVIYGLLKSLPQFDGAIDV